MRTFQLILITALAWATGAAQSFTVASYNVENFVGPDNPQRKAKAYEARKEVRRTILRLRPDVLAFQEMGRREVLEELRMALEREGLEYPHVEFVQGPDSAIHLAVLNCGTPFARTGILPIRWEAFCGVARVRRGGYTGRVRVPIHANQRTLEIQATCAGSGSGGNAIGGGMETARAGAGAFA